MVFDVVAEDLCDAVVDDKLSFTFFTVLERCLAWPMSEGKVGLVAL
ncbi:hypothetical protein ACFQRB_14185 [Halobaculum litoreum]|uniref:Uncharacterized protein n=1 Tax=Halobaculum litoreum TaxID=3031998 RepID=A0ABD5XUG0_9EURY